MKQICFDDDSPISLKKKTCKRWRKFAPFSHPKKSLDKAIVAGNNEFTNCCLLTFHLSVIFWRWNFFFLSLKFYLLVIYLVIMKQKLFFSPKLCQRWGLIPMLVMKRHLDATITPECLHKLSLNRHGCELFWIYYNKICS